MWMSTCSCSSNCLHNLLSSKGLKFKTDVWFVNISKHFHAFVWLFQSLLIIVTIRLWYSVTVQAKWHLPSEKNLFKASQWRGTFDLLLGVILDVEMTRAGWRLLFKYVMYSNWTRKRVGCYAVQLLNWEQVVQKVMKHWTVASVHSKVCKSHEVHCKGYSAF